MGIGSHMVMVLKNVAVAAKYSPNQKGRKRHEKSVEKTKKKHAKLVSSRAGRHRRASKKSKNWKTILTVVLNF